MKTKRILTITLSVLLLTFLWGCNLSVNKSVHVRDGETLDHGASSVNGSIIIGSNCRVRGGSSTVNGGIRVGKNSEVGSLKTVNSGIRVGEDSYVDGSVGTVNGRVKLNAGARVDGEVTTVNGSITCEPGVKIAGKATTVNGKINLAQTEVKEDIKTHNGHITLVDKSVVHGDIVIGKTHGFSSRTRRLDIRIEGDSLVKGDIIVKDDRRKVTVYLSGGGKVEGKIRNAEVVKD